MKITFTLLGLLFIVISSFSQATGNDSLSPDTCVCKSKPSKKIVNKDTLTIKLPSTNFFKDSTIIIYQINNNETCCSEKDSTISGENKNVIDIVKLFDIFIRLIQVSIWPLMILFLVLFFKSKLPLIIPYIKSIKYKDLQVEIDHDIFEATKKTDAIENEYYSSRPAEKVKRQDLNFDKLNRLSNESPRAVILEVWLELEDVLKRCAKQFQFDKTQNIYAIMNQLYRKEILSSSEMQLLNEMRVIRNNVFHLKDYSLDKDAAMDYAVSIYKLVDVLKSKCALE